MTATIEFGTKKDFETAVIQCRRVIQAWNHLQNGMGRSGVRIVSESPLDGGGLLVELAPNDPGETDAAERFVRRCGPLLRNARLIRWGVRSVLALVAAAVAWQVWFWSAY